MLFLSALPKPMDGRPQAQHDERRAETPVLPSSSLLLVGTCTTARHPDPFTYGPATECRKDADAHPAIRAAIAGTDDTSK